MSLTADISAGPARESTPVDSRRARTRVTAVALMVGSLVTAGLTAWHPEPDSHDHFAYDVVEPIRTEWWAWHVFGGIGMAAAAVAASLAVCMLVPRRGAMLATTGAVLTSLGGLAFAAGIAAEGVLFAYATDTDGLSAEAGRELMHHANENPELYVAAIIPGAILLTLGPLLLAGALWRAGSAPRWLVVVWAVTNIVGFVTPFGLAATVINLTFTAMLLGIAAILWRTTTNH